MLPLPPSRSQGSELRARPAAPKGGRQQPTFPGRRSRGRRPRHELHQLDGDSGEAVAAGAVGCRVLRRACAAGIHVRSGAVHRVGADDGRPKVVVGMVIDTLSLASSALRIVSP